MAKAPKDTRQTSEEEAFEIIELATDDLNVLTKAFDIIAEVCEELNDPCIELDDELPEKLMN